MLSLPLPLHTVPHRAQTAGMVSNQMKQSDRGFEIVLLLKDGMQRTRRFKAEAKVVEYLKATYTTEAPLSFCYADGAPVLSPALERIYSRVFEV